MVNLKKIFKNKLIDFYIQNIILFDIQSLSNNTSIPIEIIEMLPEYNWNWNHLSINENINIDFIVKFKDKPFNWNNLTIHQNILFKDIISNLDLNWNIDLVSLNKNITENDIIYNINFHWVIHYLLNNKTKISKNVILKIIEYRGIKDTELYEYEYIYMDFYILIKSYEQKKLNDLHLREKMNIKPVQSIFNIDLNNISDLNLYNFIIEEELITKEYFINKIKHWWYEIISNPNHPIGIKNMDTKFKKCITIKNLYN